MEIETLRSLKIFDRYICDEIEKRLINNYAEYFRPICDEMRQFRTDLQNLIVVRNTNMNKQFEDDEIDVEDETEIHSVSVSDFPNLSIWQLNFVISRHNYNYYYCWCHFGIDGRLRKGRFEDKLFKYCQESKRYYVKIWEDWTNKIYSTKNDLECFFLRNR